MCIRDSAEGGQEMPDDLERAEDELRQAADRGELPDENENDQESCISQIPHSRMIAAAHSSVRYRTYRMRFGTRIRPWHGQRRPTIDCSRRCPRGTSSACTTSSSRWRCRSACPSTKPAAP